jgi:hypothetical protein
MGEGKETKVKRDKKRKEEVQEQEGKDIKFRE